MLKVCDGVIPVSYTHLDVYKRQTYMHAMKGKSTDPGSFMNVCNPCVTK